MKSQQKSLKLGKRKNTQNLTYGKPSKLAKHLTSQKQQIMSKNKIKNRNYKGKT